MKIFVCSCDKNTELFEPFHHCMEKYWPDHPEIIYCMETIENPYYKTICKNYPLHQGTRRIREALEEINDNQIIVMMDDLFIRTKVDVERINYLSTKLSGNIACFNFEKQFDNTDLDTDVENFKRRNHGSKYEVSIMCGMWAKDKLIKILEFDSDPGTVEKNRDNKGFDFYINSGDYIINGGYVTFKPTGLYRGKGMREAVKFFEKEGLKVDYSKGFYD